MQRMNKKGFLGPFSSPTTMLLALILVGIVVLAWVNWDSIDAKFRGTGTSLAVVQVSDQTKVATTATTAGAAGGDATLEALKCSGVDQVSWTPRFTELYNPTVKANDQFAYKVNGVEVSDVAEPETAINVPPKANIQVIYNSNYSTSAQASWLSVIDEFTSPCEKFTSITEVPDIKASMLTVKMWNSYDGELNSATVYDRLTAGQTKTVKMNIAGSYEDQLGATKMAVCVEYNNTGQWDEVVPNKGVKVNKPDRISTTSGSSEPCYEFDALKSNGELDITWTLDTNDDYYFAGGDNMTFTFIDDAAYRNADTLAYEYGYETNKNADVGAADETATFYSI